MKAILLLSLVLGVFLTGCGPSQQNMIGKWKGEVKMPEDKKDDPMAKMGEAMLGMFTMDLELKEENKFSLTMLFIPIAGT
jgi:hypothetical protein